MTSLVRNDVYILDIFQTALLRGEICVPVAVSPTNRTHSLTAFFGSGEADLSELNRCLEQLAACNLNERAEMTNSSATPSAPAAA